MQGRVVCTPKGSLPYKVVLFSGETIVSEHPVCSVQEGEALIRAKCDGPIFFTRDSERDWHAPDEAIMRMCREI